jgi:hypothetical protein
MKMKIKSDFDISERRVVLVYEISYAFHNFGEAFLE